MPAFLSQLAAATAATIGNNSSSSDTTTNLPKKKKSRSKSANGIGINNSVVDSSKLGSLPVIPTHLLSSAPVRRYKQYTEDSLQQVRVWTRLGSLSTQALLFPSLRLSAR